MAKLKKPLPTTAPADPSAWSDKSRQSVAATFRTSYTDQHYHCSVCGKDAVFTALEQQRVFEVLKAPIHKRRFLCEPCWRDQHALERELALYDARWAQEKVALRRDALFLQAWLALLLENQRYGARPDSAKKAMLSKLLNSMAETGAA